MQTEQVKGMFQMWEAQFKMEENPSADAEKVEWGQESEEGLAVETTEDGKKIIKGGRLMRLIEWITSINVNGLLRIDIAAYANI